MHRNSHPAQNINPNQTAPIHQEDSGTPSVFNRPTVNGIGKIIPVIAALTQFAFIGYSMFLYNSKLQSPFQGNIKYLYIILVGIPVISIILFPIYFSFLNLFRNSILTLFVSFTLVGGGLIALLGVLTLQIAFIVVGVVLLLVNFLYLWCLWDKIKLATITIKAALIGLSKKFGSIFGSFFIRLFFNAILFGLVVICGIFTSVLCEQDPTKTQKFKHLSDSEGSILISLSGVSFIFLIYSIEALAAISYIFGAAFFNQTSLKVEQKGVNDHSKDAVDYDEVKKEAAHIAFSSSSGVGYIGALVVTIVSLLAESAKQNANDKDAGLGAVLLSCIMSLLEEFVRFLTAQAYVYTAIHGRGLIDSGKMAFESFKTAGFEKYFNYNLASKMLNLMSFLFSAMLGVAAALGFWFLGEDRIYDKGIETGEKIGISVVLGFAATIMVFLPYYSVNSIVSGNAASQIAVYVEDPDRLVKTHPESERFVKYIKA